MFRHRPKAALLLLAALCACGEERHYSVNLRGEARRVDADGNPLPGETLPDFGAVKGSLRGAVEIDPSVAFDPGRFACIFLMAARLGSSSPDVVSKIDNPTFPLEFTLGAEAGHGEGLSQGEYQVMAWLDSDGDAGRQPGDIIGQARQPASPGGAPVVVLLEHMLTAEDLPPAEPVAPAAPFAGGADGSGPTAEDLAGPRFRGTVDLAPEFAVLNGKHSLFLVVRSPQTEQGMPLAVKRVEAAQFPLTFDLGTEDVPLAVENKAEMIGGTVKIFARLAVSGQAKAAAGDIESAPLLTEPAEGLVLRLDTRRSP